MKYVDEIKQYPALYLSFISAKSDKVSIVKSIKKYGKVLTGQVIYVGLAYCGKVVENRSK